MSKPICFMVMPYGQRKTGIDQGHVPEVVDFDALWEKAFCPAIEKLGYESIRADQDLGALIIKEMIERLTLADLVVADVTIPNANVYYEIGVRHAAKETGCVMMAAAWSRQLFDISQMPHLRYPLSEGQVSADSSAAIQSLVEENLIKFSGGQSPVYQSVPGYPDKIDPKNARSFRDFAHHLSTFQGKVKAIRRTPAKDQEDRVRALLREYPTEQPVIPAIALELMYVFRDFVGWKDTRGYIETLPEELRQLPVVQEQYNLALSKTGDHHKAVEALEVLVEQFGDSSELQGLLGGRYKKLFGESTGTRERSEYLDLAIEHYEQGMVLDLNDYYPSSNLPRLYRTRNEEGDQEAARNVSVIALMACERAREMNPEDPWVKPTLLGVAFDTGKVADAQKLYQEIRKSRPADWKIDTMLSDLGISIDLHQDQEVQKELRLIAQRLEKLVGDGNIQ